MAGQSWTVSARGGTLTSVNLSRKVRQSAQPKQLFRQYVRPEEDFGKNDGDQLTYKKVGNVAAEGRVVSEFEKVPETSISFTSDTITAYEYSNSVPYTWRVETLAKLDIRSLVIEALKNDMSKVLDKAVYQEFVRTDLKYTPTGTETSKTNTLGTTGTAVAATRQMSVWDHKNIIDKMKATYFMPQYDSRGYMAIATTTFLRSIMDDSEWLEAVKYGDPSRLFDGEVGRIYACRFTEATHAMNGSLAGGLGEAIYFGEDVCIEIAAYPEELQAKLGADYGRDRGIRWVFVGGFKHAWDFSTDGDARAIHVTST